MPTRDASRLLLPILALTLFSSVLAPSSVSQTFTILHEFTGAPDGYEPLAYLLRDTAGNLYGTTDAGGTRLDAGTIFRLDTTGKENILHYFYEPNGSSPRGSLVLDSQGNAYGTAYYGGNTICYDYTCGAIYKIEKSLKYTVLHFFTGSDGAFPVGAMVRDPQGNMYGTTTEGGTANLGVIFKIDSSGNFSVLHNFDGANDGGYPQMTMIRGPAGYLYGTTYWGGGNGHGAGTIFRFDPSSGQYTVLHVLNPKVDGGESFGRLVADSQGNLYGTTSEGGIENGGTIFKLGPSRQFTVLHNFALDAPEGYGPEAGLIMDAQGNLYGTTWIGDLNCKPGYACGTVFKMDPQNNVTVLHAFDIDDGEAPSAELTMDPDGNLYGTTWLGGPGQGVLFKITPQ